MSQIFNELMKDKELEKKVLIEFGFGDVNKTEVIKWIKREYPVRFAEIKKNITPSKVVKFAPNDVEMTTKEYRNTLLDNVMTRLDSAPNEQFSLEVERDNLTELIFDFVQQNELENKFLHFLKKSKLEGKYSGVDIDFMMMDYK